MADKMINVVPGDGVSIYTGYGHAPFGKNHVVSLPDHHADMLLEEGFVTLHKPAPTPAQASAQPEADTEHHAAN